MARQIIKQPGGKYAIFSTVTDTLIVLDATAAELEEYFGEEAREAAVRGVRDIMTELEAGGRPYRQFTMTWEKAAEKSRRHGGPSLPSNAPSEE